MTSTHVIRKGCFRSVFPLLDIDEWTYLLGLKIKDQDMEDVLKSFALLDGFLDPEIFDFLNLHEGILITHIDGWWECFPFDHILMKNIGKNLLSAYTNSDKWVKFDQDYNIEVYPDFTAE